jgi:arginine decarboxylase
VHGEALLHETLAASRRVRELLARTPDVAVVGPELVGRPGVTGWDPLRLVLDVRQTGRTGYEVAEVLRGTYDAQPELATHATMVFVLGMGQPVPDLDRLAGDVDETIKRLTGPGATTALVRPSAALRNDSAVSPRDAFLGRAERVGVDDAVGRVSAESIAGYPPGIPALLPGERISAEAVAYLRELVAAGARLHGAVDPGFETIAVLAGA